MFNLYNIFQLDEADLEAELAALGDELELDADTSYLDEAINAPAVPSRDPASKVSKLIFLLFFILKRIILYS